MWYVIKRVGEISGFDLIAMPLQCQKYMHVSKGWDCFAVFHSKKYHRQILLMFIPMFSDVVFLKNIRKKKNNFFYLVAFIFVSGNSCDLVLVFSGRTLIS